MIDQRYNKRLLKVTQLLELLKDGECHSLEEVKDVLKHKSSIKHIIEDLNSLIKEQGGHREAVFCIPPYSNKTSLCLIDIGVRKQ